MKSKSMKDLINLYGEDRVESIKNDLFSLLGFMSTLDDRQDSKMVNGWIDDIINSLDIKGDMLEESIKTIYITKEQNDIEQNDIENNDAW